MTDKTSCLQGEQFAGTDETGYRDRGDRLPYRNGRLAALLLVIYNMPLDLMPL
jgi:hypothetical protein